MISGGSKLSGFSHISVDKALHRHRRESWVQIPLEPPEFFRCQKETIGLIVQISARITSFFRLSYLLVNGNPLHGGFESPLSSTFPLA